MNPKVINAEQAHISSKYRQSFTPKYMETPNHNVDILFNKELYTIEWNDIKNVEMDYDNYLNDLGNFLNTTEFEEEVPEEDS